VTFSDLSQVFSFFIGFLFQSIQVTFVTFGLGVAVILVVRGLILPHGLLNENLPVDVKGGRPPLVDVQQAPRDLASAEGDEREAAMTVDGHGHVLLFSQLHERSQFIVTSIALLHVNYILLVVAVIAPGTVVMTESRV
jgi:hypothetical protein